MAERGRPAYGPAPLHEPIVAAQLTGELGRRLHCFDVVRSTMDEARRLAQLGAPHGTAVLAEEQRAGRGRAGRPWLSPRRFGLYLTVILHRDRLPAELGPLALLVAVATRDAVVAVAGVAPGLKWPNDLVAGGAKLGGILVEAPVAPPVALVGVGVNVGGEGAVPPPEPGAGVTSLAALGAPAVDRNLLAAALLNALGGWLERWRLEGAAPVVAAWRAANVTLGRRVRVAASGFAGVATDVTAAGALVVTGDDGRRLEVHAGDVIAS
jgi:BirA family biotin operon repressor/biotin-[acetyl-CoA-carboxylase] ligase